MAYNVRYDFEGGATVGSVIGAEHFGTNYLFHHDRVGADSTFPEIMDRVGIDLIRYPGGTVTEEFFDLSNPTATLQPSILGRNDRDVTPIQEFLNYAAQSGSKAVIVLPTYRYFDQDTREIDPAAEAIIKDFVRAVLAGDYGDAQISGFEIGNEWYQDKFNWSAAEFGELQSKMALWIDEVIQEDAEWSDTGVYIQAGRGDDDGNGIEDDQELAAQFTQQELDAVDGLISHFYASTSSGNSMILGGNVNRRLKDMADYWDTSDETGLDLVVTEWNIGGNGPDDTSVTGLMRNVALLNVFSNMMEQGVDMSAIWTAQAPGPASLSNKEGDDHLTSTGFLYRMMRRELVDTQAVETVQGDEILAGNGQEIGRTYVFQGDGKTVLYLASGVGETINLNVDFGQYMTAGSHIHATVLDAAEGASATDYRVEATMKTISHGEIGNSGSYTFSLGDYEVVQVVITNGTGVRLFGDDQNATNDTFDGTAHADEIWGLDGDDEINGFDGDDLIDGGAGNDALSGGAGDDLIVGGAGSDTIDGGAGEDTLDYSDNASAVRIYAREGVAEKDESGEADAFANVEHFIGSDHDDTIFTGESTASVDSGAGKDFVRILGGDDVEVETGDGNDFVLAESGRASVDLGEGNDKLLAYSADVDVDGGAGDDVIHGGSGNDTIDGGQGNDVMSGGDGQDTFVYNNDGGTDTILDFDTSQDILDLTDLDITFADIEVVETDRGVDLRVAGQSIVQLQSVTAEEIATDMFAM
ncbi:MULTISPECIES: cellulase family glycosylhydrolase [unclassified Roseovarius]|uniref:cellulase family glycosylhydrolase n=1 Tax=unclassified Roseovarius TaxID=2614913 RepID=UPI00273D956D|nr:MULTISPECIES: cellulase family glycosylhydrolase [unclassified Roseovarius]